MNTTRLSLLTIAAALALAGCGNKGPLVLPDAPDEAEAPVAADEANEAVDESADDTDPAAEPIDDPDAPVEPDPLPPDDGAGGCAMADRLPAPQIGRAACRESVGPSG